MGELQHQPGLADLLHPGAGLRNELAGKEQPEVVVPESEQRAPQPAAGYHR